MLPTAGVMEAPPFFKAPKQDQVGTAFLRRLDNLRGNCSGVKKCVAGVPRKLFAICIVLPLPLCRNARTFGASFFQFPARLRHVAACLGFSLREKGRRALLNDRSFSSMSDMKTLVPSVDPPMLRPPASPGSPRRCG